MRSPPRAGGLPGVGRRPWQERVALLRRAADLISERQMVLAALMAIEVGKNRLEALGDVEETADLIRWCCDMIERNNGFDRPMGNLGDAAVHTRSVLKPHGVWAVISPFNFPMALSGGPSGGGARRRQHGRLQAVERRAADRASTSPRSSTMRACRAGVFNMVDGPGRVGRRRAPGERRRRRDHCSPARSRSGSTSSGTSAGATRSPRSSRWAARTRRSCRGPPTSRRPPRASCGRRSVSADRSVPRIRGSTSSGRCSSRSSTSSSRRPRRSRSATRSCARTGWAR